MLESDQKTHELSSESDSKIDESWLPQIGTYLFSRGATSISSEPSQGQDLRKALKKNQTWFYLSCVKRHFHKDIWITMKCWVNQFIRQYICMLEPATDGPGTLVNLLYILYSFRFLFLCVTSIDLFINCCPMDLLKFLFAMLAIDLGKHSFWGASKLIALEVWGEEN